MVPTFASPLNGHSCEHDCDKSFMALNQDPRWTQPDERGVPHRFIYTEQQNINQLSKDDYFYVDAYSVFLHELGHWFGLNHADGPDSFGSVCDHPNAIVRNPDPDPDLSNQVRRDLDVTDICAFKKAYCCAQTANGVEESLNVPKAPSFVAIPNPARSSVLLQFSEPVRAKGASLRVVSSIGEVIEERVIGREARSFNLDVSPLPAGVYVVEVVTRNAVFGAKVIVQH
jgi:hypothetical protein